MTHQPVDPRTGELLKPVRNGVTIYSRTIKYAGGDNYPLGGIVIDSTSDTEGEIFTVANLHWGRVEYHHIPADDIDPHSYTGEIAVKPSRDLATRMNLEMARNPHTDHLHALLALTNAINTRGVPAR